MLTGLADAILAWFNDGGNVYLYRAHGVSRASHIDIAIHCRALGIGADDALARIKAQRPIADRTQVFWPNSKRPLWKKHGHPAGRADIVTKSRAHQGSKNVHGPWTVEESSLLPSGGAASPPTAGGL